MGQSGWEAGQGSIQTLVFLSQPPLQQLLLVLFMVLQQELGEGRPVATLGPFSTFILYFWSVKSAFNKWNWFWKEKKKERREFKQKSDRIRL